MKKLGNGLVRSSIAWSLIAGLLGLGQMASAQVTVNVSLTPAGDFKAQTEKIDGVAYRTQTGVVAENIRVDANSLKTGMSLRDKHLKERLMTDKFPIIRLVRATGQDGKGTATLEIKGIQIESQGTYKIQGSSLIAQFKLQLPALKITNVKYMNVGVEDEVSLEVKVPLRDRPAGPERAAKSGKK